MSGVEGEAATLPFGEYGTRSDSATIVLIHGAFANRHEWDPVIPELSKSYHVISVDLPEHGEAHQVASFSKDLSATLIARLIRDTAIDGQAHIVGWSLGAHVAIALAVRHPDVVKDVFVSGYEMFPSFPLFPQVLWASQRIENAMPRAVTRWLMDGADIDTSSASTPPTLQKCRNVTQTMSAGSSWPSPWPARTLIVAAGKSGLLPTADHPHDATKLRDIGRQLHAETVAYTHPEMRHPWNRQAPRLCAETAVAWFGRRLLPDGFRVL